MKTITHNGNGLPNNYGRLYITSNSIFSYITDLLCNFKNAASGTLLDLMRTRIGKRKHVHNRFKMEGPDFTQQLNIQQTVKYGAILYIATVMVVMPASICSSSHQSPVYELPVITHSFVSELLNTSFESDEDQVSFAAIPKEPESPSPVKEPNAPPFHSYILQASQAYEVDIALIRAIIMAESSNNPRAVSHRGAKGLMQLMPTTAKWLGVSDAFDPELNIDGGVRYFKRLLDRFDGDIKLALAAYNAGSRYVRKYGGVPPFKATRIYIKKVLRYQQKYQKEMASSQTGLTMS